MAPVEILSPNRRTSKSQEPRRRTQQPSTYKTFQSQTVARPTCLCLLVPPRSSCRKYTGSTSTAEALHAAKHSFVTRRYNPFGRTQMTTTFRMSFPLSKIGRLPTRLRILPLLSPLAMIVTQKKIRLVLSRFFALCPR